MHKLLLSWIQTQDFGNNLAKESRPLTAFITPFDRYQFNTLPFGITSAPELFQKRMNTLLSNLKGVLCLMDDVLVYGKDQSEHDKRLKSVEMHRSSWHDTE